MESENSVDVNIVAVVIGLAFIIIVGIVVVGALNTSSTSGDIETFTVNDITVNRVCGLDDDVSDEAVIVEYNNGGGWIILTETTDYTIGGTTITVLASAMD